MNFTADVLSICLEQVVRFYLSSILTLLQSRIIVLVMDLVEGVSLRSLASSIQESANTLQALLDQHNLPQPTFSPGGRSDWVDSQCQPSILAARSKLIDTSQTLLNFVLGPSDILAAYAGPRVTEIEVLRTMDTLNVAAVVPLDTGSSVCEVARKVGVKNMPAFEKQLRFAYLMGLFRQGDGGMIYHTALSAELPNSRAWVGLRLSKLFNQGCYDIATALCTEVLNGTPVMPCALADPKRKGRSCYEQLEDDVEGKGMEVFSQGMVDLFSLHSGGSSLPFLRGFDWESLSEGAVVVDIGGGNGHIEAEIAPFLPKVLFEIQDQPSNQEAAQRLTLAHGLDERVHFQAHDFFSLQPERPKYGQPAVYLLIRVLQDWRDADCVSILRPLIPAMEKFGTKLWIMNRVLPDDVDTMPIHKEKMLRSLDLLVFTLSGGGERSVLEFERLFALVDSRLKIQKSVRPLNSLFSFIEAVLV
ncbi:hypothetical protein ONS95_001190 [Cadophora gregata]|uniref:uncharacterized protein n=1 Tax=Cadophora gregata TaxID=51156 RepID=UPI0026DBB670|nr:uncharacterized protein ONS95_001190 [Cadophora gregata]KAK0102004.1 hypothetical protein ONS96_005972 [Cadophora gregata f. sp. sojae]KAK0129255.1 hypothetical protein ONS95_001190 [Cadophora gregata]